MKKLLCLLFTLMLVLCACGDSGNGDTVPQITIGNPQNDDKTPQDTTAAPAESENEATQGSEEGFAFVFEGVSLIPGTAFDAAALPTPASTYVVPSCALEGTDNVYNYEAFEVTAYNEGKGEFIYSVYFINPNLTTPEGLAIGDAVTKAESLYGTDYTQDNGAYVYTQGATQLILIAQDGVIISIEYRMVTG